MLLPRSLLVASVAVATGTVVPVVALGDTVAGAGTPQVSKSTVQTQSAKNLAAETGQKRPKVTCPSGVAARVGAVIHCTVVPDGTTVRYPATVTVRSIHGSTADFYVQVGQAPGHADHATFCADNATINRALSAATTSTAFLSALEANESVILQLQSTAPSKIVDEAGMLTQATRQAIQSGDISVFNTKTVGPRGDRGRHVLRTEELAGSAFGEAPCIAMGRAVPQASCPRIAWEGRERARARELRSRLESVGNQAWELPYLATVPDVVMSP